jgi:hypothetical protein
MAKPRKNLHAAALARKRWRKVPAARRSEIARQTVRVRWAKARRRRHNGNG